MIKNIIITIVAFLFAISIVNINYSVKFSVINCVEMQALNSLAHIGFGMGLAAFWSMMFDKERTLILSFICIVAWEIYEIIFLGTGLFVTPADVLSDIIIGISFAWMFLKWTN